jgi:hypothetical protein
MICLYGLSTVGKRESDLEFDRSLGAEDHRIRDIHAPLRPCGANIFDLEGVSRVLKRPLQAELQWRRTLNLRKGLCVSIEK